MSEPDPKIIPRWEWRTFGLAAARLEARMGSCAQARTQESDEIYLLHRAGRANAKIRDDRLDIKVLQDRDPSGLELWQPVFKAGFPLSEEAIRDAFAVLDSPCPRLEQTSYPRATFLDEIAGRAPALRIVPVHKARRKFTFMECFAERARMCGEGWDLESACLESRDKALVFAALHALHADPKANLNVPEGLRRALAAIQAA
jgi:exopolyphosphatase/guanosine-5'-triphosphate,3'-diphosphate pyrophosphatase